MNKLLTAKQVGELIGCSEKTIYGWAVTGHLGIPAIKFGTGQKSPVRFDPVEIDKWIKDLAEKSQRTAASNAWYNEGAETVARPRKGEK